MSKVTIYYDNDNVKSVEIPYTHLYKSINSKVCTLPVLVCNTLYTC